MRVCVANVAVLHNMLLCFRLAAAAAVHHSVH